MAQTSMELLREKTARLTYPVIKTVPRAMMRDVGCGRWKGDVLGLRLKVFSCIDQQKSGNAFMDPLRTAISTDKLATHEILWRRALARGFTGRGKG
jgi:hypothetical protein